MTQKGQTSVDVRPIYLSLSLYPQSENDRFVGPGLVIKTSPGRRSIRLSKRIKNEVQLVLHDPDPGIRDTKLKRYTLVVESEKTGTKRDVAFTRNFGRRELDRVADKIRSSWRESPMS
jgi:hypothetical protein